MGSHQRDKAQFTEEVISKSLKYNGNILSKVREKNYLELSEIIIDEIKDDYNINSAEAIGNSYDTIGDIKLYTDSGDEIFVELKITESGGTLANLSQDALTKYKIVKNVKSWSEYRNDEKNHEDWVRNYLDEYEYSPDVRDDNTKTSIYDKSKYLKKKINCGQKNTENVANSVLEESDDKSKIKAAQIILDIINRSKKEKIDYIEYIKNNGTIDNNNLKKFVYALLSGYSREEDISKYINVSLDNLDNINSDKYVIYRGYTEDMSVVKEDANERVKILLDKNINIDIEFPSNEYGFNIKRNGEDIIRGQYHWKNKFNGIQTPCINLFDEKE